VVFQEAGSRELPLRCIKRPSACHLQSTLADRPRPAGRGQELIDAKRSFTKLWLLVCGSSSVRLLA
jgi:hypothetical protein